MDQRNAYGEDRIVTIGLAAGVVLFVVTTERDGDRIRLISARKAITREELRYFEGDDHGWW